MLKITNSIMSFLQRVRFTLGVLGLAAFVPSLGYAQTGYVVNGGEFAPAGNLPGDQVYPAVALAPSGGYLVWEDNITDGDGLGISAIRLDSTFSPTFSTFRVNKLAAGDQENPQVAILSNGGVAIIWQGGQRSFQHIYASFYSTNGTNINLTNDVMVSTATNHYQVNPAIAPLKNGNLVAVWGSYGQDNADGLQGVYGQVLSPAGQKIGGEFSVNQTTPYNQRTPAVATFPNGNFIVVWISELQNASLSLPGGTLVVSNSAPAASGRNSVDVYARLFNSNGVALGNEFQVNTNTRICADPVVAVASDSSFIISWGEKDTVVTDNSWDVFARQYASTSSANPVQRVNTQQYGDQYAPKISVSGTDYMIVWTSLGQDGSREGVFSQFLYGNGSPNGVEFQVNTTVLNAQKYPAVASDGAGRFLAVWSSYVGGLNSMDLYAQRYISSGQVLSPPAPPIISALDYYLLSAAWAPLAGLPVDHWNLYVDNAGTPVSTTDTYWQNENADGPYTNDFAASSVHTFQLAYVLTNGTQSPLSAVASGKTWGTDRNHDGLPDDWETMYFGSNSATWPNANTVLTSGSLHASVLQIFQQGANPNNPATWLVAGVSHTPQGYFLNWNTQPGGIYQVMTTSDLHTWTNVGGPRFAAGTADSLYLGLTPNSYYKISRLIY